MNALLDEFGVGDAQERDESWRYSKTALRALSQQDFEPAATDAKLSPALTEQFDWPETRGCGSCSSTEKLPSDIRTHTPSNPRSVFRKKTIALR